jgi:hypothetical protein
MQATGESDGVKSKLTHFTTPEQKHSKTPPFIKGHVLRCVSAGGRQR